MKNLGQIWDVSVAKKKARLFLTVRVQRRTFGGVYARSKLSLTDNPVGSSNQRPLCPLPRLNLPLSAGSLRHYTSPGTLECVNYCTQGILTTAVCICSINVAGQVRVGLHTLAPSHSPCPKKESSDDDPKDPFLLINCLTPQGDFIDFTK